MTVPGPHPAVVVQGAYGRGGGDHIKLRLSRKGFVGDGDGGHNLENGRGLDSTRDVLTGHDGVGGAIEDVGKLSPLVVGEYPIRPSRHGVAASGLDHTARAPEVIRP